MWGYEIHKGITMSSNPILEDDGCASEDGMCWGTYLHGLFWNENVQRALGGYLGIKFGQKDDWADFIADEVERRLDLGVVGL